MSWPEHPYGMIESERTANLLCQREHKSTYEVLVRNGNFSAFNGYHWTPSAYSLVKCGTCGRSFRSKAAYVDSLPDAI